jgi:hypothetical protein
LIGGLVRDAEWAFFEPFATPKTGRPSAYRRVLDGIFWVTRTGHRSAICPKNWASGTASISNSSVGACRGFGTCCSMHWPQAGGVKDGAEDRLHGDPRPPSSGRRKKGAQGQALGRSRGGSTSKITPAPTATAFHSFQPWEQKPKTLAQNEKIFREQSRSEGAMPPVRH